MATPHALSGEVVDILPYGAAIAQAVSSTLVRSDHLEVFRIVLPAGKTVPEHQVPHVITVQCIEGVIKFVAHGTTKLMRAGGFLYLSPNEPHTLEAVEDASVLVTLLVRRE